MATRRGLITLLPLLVSGMTALGVATYACGGAKTEAAGPSKTPPGAAGGPTTSTEERVFAVDSILLGEADRSGNRSKDAWKSFGFNLDGRVTNVTDGNSPDLAAVCKRAQNARATIHQDGDQGIDNTFGKEVLPLLSLVLPAPSKTVTDSIHAGTFTVMLKLVGLTDDPVQTNTGLSGTILVGGIYGSAPAFDQNTDWPFEKASTEPIASAYINNGVFVNGQGGSTVHLDLHIGGQTLALVINNAAITFKHDPAGRSLDEGTIAGVMNTEQFVASVVNVAGAVDFSFCSGPSKQNLVDTIRQSSDMLSNGTQDPNANCDAISIGVGFTAKRVAPPTKEAVPVDAGGDPCTTPRDAGADG